MSARPKFPLRQTAAMAIVVASMTLGGLTGCGGGSSYADTLISADAPKFVPLNDSKLELLVTPSTIPEEGHKRIIDAINTASTSVKLVMFLLTDEAVITALKQAKTRKVVVNIILNESTLDKKKYENNLRIYHDLHDLGIVRRSSTGFSITHEKSMLIDDKTLFITAMNMTNGYPTERDYGVITTDSHVIKEWRAVFDADIENSDNTKWPADWPDSQPQPKQQSNNGNTPPLSVPSLLWSPVSSTNKLIALIESATKSIVATVENITDTPVSQALEAAAQRHVQVKLITPQCVVGDTPELNYPTLYKLQDSKVDIRVMPHDSKNPTSTNPYMHSKMILVDQTVAYVGSINFTDNSLNKARETGIIFINSDATQTIDNNFGTDWKNAIALPPAPYKKNQYCPSSS